MLSGRSSPPAAKGTTKTVIPIAERGSMFAFATAAVEAAAMCGRRSAHLLFEALQGAYDGHLERAQMRLAPVKSRSWRDIPRAGAEDCYCRPALSMTLAQAETTNR